MRSWALHFAQNGDLLGLLRNEQLVSIPERDIARGARGTLHDSIDIDNEPTDGLCFAKLRQQLLPDRQTLSCAGCAVGVRRGRAAGDSLERQCRQIALQPIGQEFELVLFTLLQFFAYENRTLLKRKVGESAGPPHY